VSPIDPDSPSKYPDWHPRLRIEETCGLSTELRGPCADLQGLYPDGADKNTTELLIACESCCKLASACSRAALVT
jgi:hypothetical protein